VGQEGKSPILGEGPETFRRRAKNSGQKKHQVWGDDESKKKPEKKKRERPGKETLRTTELGVWLWGPIEEASQGDRRATRGKSGTTRKGKQGDPF